ncbi:SpaA isopeptide-forming pilin-related protein [Streptomyces hirsutus]|uniref:SpaA isopeptide-forming pilin-related protein n=1 Tax=Streptomyces hirsutus TaxID=35620 RepID=UPI0006E20191|nr:SpaA isopeptide-forming pilin-related protein [Streptomyces hirsutus]
MHARIVRGAVRSAALATAVTGTLTWAPTATAQPAEPTPSAFTALPETPAPDAGSVAITKTDPAGDPLAGASFLLLDTPGQEVGRGKTDARGKLTFPDLAPGVYRLKETSSGSPLHDVVADQDVIVTPGATAHLTITDPFKAAQVVLKAKDDKTGKLLPGSTVNIGSGDKTLLTLTTGPKGTASGELPVSSRKTEFWVKQIKAPEGYDLYKPSKTFTAGPGAPVTVTVTNAKTATTPKPDPSGTSTDNPTATPSAPGDKPSEGGSGESKPAPTGTSTPDADSPVPAADPGDDATPKVPAGSLAHTGAGATPWIVGGAGLLVAVGIGTVVATRRRTAAEPEHDDNGQTS